MKKYKIFVIETLSKEVEIEANSSKEAKAIANDMRSKGEIILTADDFDNFSIHCWETCKINEK